MTREKRKSGVREQPMARGRTQTPPIMARGHDEPRAAAPRIERATPHMTQPNAARGGGGLRHTRSATTTARGVDVRRAAAACDIAGALRAGRPAVPARVRPSAGPPPPRAALGLRHVGVARSIRGAAARGSS